MSEYDPDNTWDNLDFSLSEYSTDSVFVRNDIELVEALSTESTDALTQTVTFSQFEADVSSFTNESGVTQIVTFSQFDADVSSLADESGVSTQTDVKTGFVEALSYGLTDSLTQTVTFSQFDADVSSLADESGDPTHMDVETDVAEVTVKKISERSSGSSLSEDTSPRRRRGEPDYRIVAERVRREFLDVEDVSSRCSVDVGLSSFSSIGDSFSTGSSSDIFVDVFSFIGGDVSDGFSVGGGVGSLSRISSSSNTGFVVDAGVRCVSRVGVSSRFGGGVGCGGVSSLGRVSADVGVDSRVSSVVEGLSETCVECVETGFCVSGSVMSSASAELSDVCVGCNGCLFVARRVHGFEDYRGELRVVDEERAVKVLAAATPI